MRDQLFFKRFVEKQSSRLPVKKGKDINLGYAMPLQNALDV